MVHPVVQSRTAPPLLVLRIEPGVHKAKAPRFIEGLLCDLVLCLNQPHPSMPSESLSESDRYDLSKFFTE